MANSRFRYVVKLAGSQAFRLLVKMSSALHLLPYEKSLGPDAPERFLLINLAGHLGDAVMLLPTVEALRRAHPTARIEYAVETSAAPLLRLVPALDHVYALKLGSKPPLSAWRSWQRAVHISYLYWRSMRHALPTTCIVLRWGDDLFRSTILAYLTQAPRRIGFASDVLTPGDPADHFRDALLTDAVHGGQKMHEAAKFLFLLQHSALIPSGDPQSIIAEPSASLQSIASCADWPALAAKLNIDPKRRFAVIAPGASMPRRVWPLDHWVRVTQSLSDFGVSVVLLSGPSDAATAQELQGLLSQQSLPSTLVAGITTLPESVTLLSHATIFLGNDSGPGHVAGALGTPSVILFATLPGCDQDSPGTPERNRPTGPSVQTCRPAKALPPCTHICLARTAHCITTTSVDDVVASARQFLATSLVTPEAILPGF